MSAPTFPGCGPRSRTAPAWEWIWDEMADGQWHRGAELAEQALREGVVQVERTTVMGVMYRAANAGLIEREVRAIHGAGERYNPAFGTLRQSKLLSRPRRPAHEAWYRRRIKGGGESGSDLE